MGGRTARTFWMQTAARDGEKAMNSLYASLGTTVFFGMLGVTGFGLVFTPVFYTALRRWVGRRGRARGTTLPAPSEHAAD